MRRCPLGCRADGHQVWLAAAGLLVAGSQLPHPREPQIHPLSKIKELQ
jgi:hypothetical protein